MTEPENRKVPHVDLANGYLRVANELWDAIFSSEFSAEEYKIIGMLIRNTYGIKGRKSCEWSVRIAAKECELSHQRTRTAWKSLIKKNVVACYDSPKINAPGTWGINKNYATWNPPAVLQYQHSESMENSSNQHSNQHSKLPKSTQQTPQINTAAVLACQHSDPLQNPLPEALSEGSKDNKDKTKTIIVPPPPSFTYSYLTTAKDDPSIEVRTKLFKICLKMVETLRPTEPVKETNKRKLGAFLSTPVTEGLSEDVFLKMLKESVRRAVEESARRRQQEPKRVSCAVGTALYLMAEQFAILLGEIKQNSPRKPSTIPERKQDRRWVVYPAGSFGMPGRPHIEQWEPCWADELTDEDREKDRQSERAWRERVRQMCLAREAEADKIRAQNEENRRSRMLK